MKMIPVSDIPSAVRMRHDLAGFIKEFVKSGEEIVRIDFTEYDYKSATSCRSCLYNSARRHGYNIKVIKRGDEVYLRKM